MILELILGVGSVVVEQDPGLPNTSGQWVVERRDAENNLIAWRSFRTMEEASPVADRLVDELRHIAEVEDR